LFFSDAKAAAEYSLAVELIGRLGETDHWAKV